MRTRIGGRSAALVIAGGRGTRFWPESRADRPKPLFAIDGKTSLLTATIARTATFIPKERIFVLVASDQQRPFIRALHNLLPASNLIVEPEARGTAVAIAYGCATIARRLGSDTIVVAIPADHHVNPVRAYKSTLSAAISLAAGHQAIVMIGIAPTRPESGYGYMKAGRAVDSGFRIERFVEKPSGNVARRMISSGKFLWNAGMFVMPVSTLIAELERQAPALAQAMHSLPEVQSRQRKLLYRALNFDSFDRVIAERANGLLGIRATFNWHDVGSWGGLWEALRGEGQNVLSGNVITLESTRVLARAHSRLIVLLGVRDLIAVDTNDIILIARRSMSQEIRGIIAELEHRGLKHYL